MEQIRPKMVYGFLSVSVSGADGPGPAALPAERALACSFRRFRFSRSFAANLCSRAALCSALPIAMPAHRFQRRGW